MKLSKVALAIGIAALYTAFFAYGIFVVYPGPEDCYDQHDFEQTRPVKVNDTTLYPEQTEEFKQCRTIYEPAREKYYLINVIILGIFSVLSIIGGMLLPHYVKDTDSIGTGILGGGIILLIYTTIRFWGDMSKWARLIILGLGLAILIYVGYKKIEKHKSKN